MATKDDKELLESIRNELANINSQLREYSASERHYHIKETKGNKISNITSTGTAFVILAFGIIQLSQSSLQISANYLLLPGTVSLLIGLALLLVAGILGIKGMLIDRLIRKVSTRV